MYARNVLPEYAEARKREFRLALATTAASAGQLRMRHLVLCGLRVPEAPMILWDPNNLNADLDGPDARLNWGNSFWDQGLSFRTWLEGWLTEKEQPEPKWPSDSWMRKRLGFRLPK